MQRHRGTEHATDSTGAGYRFVLGQATDRGQAGNHFFGARFAAWRHPGERPVSANGVPRRPRHRKITDGGRVLGQLRRSYLRPRSMALALSSGARWLLVLVTSRALRLSLSWEGVRFPMIGG